MKVKLNIVLECYSINPIIERKDRFIWLGQQNLPLLNINNSIEFLMINIKKIKLSLEEIIEDKILKEHKIQFPFTYDDFITFARKLVLDLTNASKWLENLQYMKDYILAPLMISSKEVIIGIIILDELILKPVIKTLDILESNNYLSQITSKNNTITITKWKCDILSGILKMSDNKLSARMKLYIMNCRGYIPSILIHRMPKNIIYKKFFRANALDL